MGKTMDEGDTLRILNSLVNSGLPLPKSPSGRLLEIGPDVDDTFSQEREERGWWSLRFHQVMSTKRRLNLDTVSLTLYRYIIINPFGSEPLEE